MKKISDFNNCGAPQWSYDGKYIIYINIFSPKSIWAMDSTGNNPHKITEGDQFICSPFENKICFIRNEYENGNFRGWAIYSVNIDGSDLKQLTDLQYQKYGLKWSSEPSSVYFVLNDNLKGTFERVCKLNLTDKHIDSLFEGYELPNIEDRSADGDYFIFSANHADIYKYDIKSKRVIQLTNAIFRDEFAKISPLTGQIVFTSGRTDPLQIYMMNNDGSDQHKVSRNKNGAMIPKYSPDGSMIAYLSSDDGKSIQLTLCDAFGNNPWGLIVLNTYAYEWCPAIRKPAALPI
ncbi:MAG: TolB family protein [Syntrophothermus sp.]